MIDRLFRAHPRSVDESYPEHFGVAWRFGLAMLAGGLGALPHALVPALCARTGSDMVKGHTRSLARGRPTKALRPIGEAISPPCAARGRWMRSRRPRGRPA